MNPDDWRCSICYDLLYKPCVNVCGHTFCFWCFHTAMNPLQPSQCPLCRASYRHFPQVCALLHTLLSNLLPDEYETRRLEVEEEENSKYATKSMSVAEVPLVRESEQQQQQQQQQQLGAAEQADQKAAAALELKEQLGGKLEGDLQVPVPLILRCGKCHKLLYAPAVLSCGHVVCGPTCTPAAAAAAGGFCGCGSASGGSRGAPTPVQEAYQQQQQQQREACPAAREAEGAPAGPPSLPTSAAAAAVGTTVAAPVADGGAGELGCPVCSAAVVEPQPMACRALEALLEHCCPTRYAARAEEVRALLHQQAAEGVRPAAAAAAAVGGGAAGRQGPSASCPGGGGAASTSSRASLGAAGQGSGPHQQQGQPAAAASSGQRSVAASSSGGGQSLKQQLSENVRELLERSSSLTAAGVGSELRSLMRDYSETEYVWHHAGCDNCGVFPLVGRRYKCSDCKEEIGFDLCGPCYDRGFEGLGRFNQRHTVDHHMVKVEPEWGAGSGGGEIDFTTQLNLLQVANPELTPDQLLRLLHLELASR